MKISELIVFLEKLKAERGDVDIGIDISPFDDPEYLRYHEDSSFIFA